jgi:Leucine-rich repeat (LRR) protein
VVLRETVAFAFRGRRLQRVQHGLDALPCLLTLDLGDNELAAVEGLEGNALLEAVNLEDNRIWRIEGLAHLTHLRRLELGRNHITRLDGLAGLAHLSFLSVEDNNIQSLAPLAELAALAELYLSNNSIQSMKEVLQLRALARLVIMDLSGNGCCKEEQYRLYVVFQLKKLKVLDGAPVDVAEQAKAKDTFAGRISADLLAERISPPDTEYGQVRELSLSSCAIKEIKLLTEFRRLQHLNMDHNLLADITPLRECVALVSLNVAFNKLAQSPVPVGQVLGHMPDLESLSVEGNGIMTINQLQLRLPKLKFLNLKNNDLSRIESLEGCPQLREVVLDKNKLRQLDRDCFAGTPLLREVSCDDNAVKTMEGLRNLPNLQKLSFVSNRIGELAEVERCLETSPHMLDVSFASNQVSRKAMYRATVIHLFPVCDTVDGREVTAEERERADGCFRQEVQLAMIPPNVLTDVRHTVGVTQVGLGGGGNAQQSKTALRIMTLDTVDSGVQAPRGRGPPQGTAGKQPMPRTSSADVSMRSRPVPKPASGASAGAPGYRRQSRPVQ